jgi:hypothetical protein
MCRTLDLSGETLTSRDAGIDAAAFLNARLA